MLALIEGIFSARRTFLTFRAELDPAARLH
jgi:hypothetical protein